MAYELTFYLVTPGAGYSETNSPATSNRIDIGSHSAITITFTDDDAQLHQVGHDDTPAVLRDEVTVNGTTYPAGTEVALSNPTTFNSAFGRLTMQGLLVKDGDEWVPILAPTGSRPGLYIFAKDVNSADPDYGKPVTLPPGSHGIRSQSSNDGTVHITYNGEPDPSSPPCFTLGTLIDTPGGPRPVEALRAGDLVLTRDHGAQTVVWAGRQHLDGAQLLEAPNLRPIRIAAGALGPGCPARDLVVSPQHRILLTSRILTRITGEAEMLTPACQLLGWPGVEVLPAESGVTYLHLLFAGHEVIRAEAAWTESLYLGPEIRKRRSAMAREIATLFPALLTHTAPLPAPARGFLRGRRLRELTRRAQKNARDLVEAPSG